MGGRTARSRAKCSSNCNDLGEKPVVFSRKNGDVHYIMTFHHENISKHIKTHIKTGI
jgi:(2Fe-2S) ferredoxin